MKFTKHFAQLEIDFVLVRFLLNKFYFKKVANKAYK